MVFIENAESRFQIQSKSKLDPVLWWQINVARAATTGICNLFPSSDTGILEPLLDIASLKRINQFAHLAAEKSVE